MAASASPGVSCTDAFKNGLEFALARPIGNSDALSLAA